MFKEEEIAHLVTPKLIIFKSDVKSFANFFFMMTRNLLITAPIKIAFHVQNRGIPCKNFLAHNFHPKIIFDHYLMAVKTTKSAKFPKIGNLNFI